MRNQIDLAAFARTLGEGDYVRCPGAKIQGLYIGRRNKVICLYGLVINVPCNRNDLFFSWELTDSS